ncbi:MAG: HU family DNA-binding protein [Thermoleophilaceae bacterium]|nr:HU family DNA-binding protein [Thermoleophilaceae bacterium]
MSSRPRSGCSSSVRGPARAPPRARAPHVPRPPAVLVSPRPSWTRIGKQTQEEERVTKAEVVDQVAAEADLSKNDAGEAVDAVLKVIEDALARGGEVNFTGFGKFTVAERGARQGVNPQTGEKIQISASKVPRFSAGSALKKSVKS